MFNYKAVLGLLFLCNLTSLSCSHAPKIVYPEQKQVSCDTNLCVSGTTEKTTEYKDFDFGSMKAKRLTPYFPKQIYVLYAYHVINQLSKDDPKKRLLTQKFINDYAAKLARIKNEAIALADVLNLEEHDNHVADAVEKIEPGLGLIMTYEKGLTEIQAEQFKNIFVKIMNEWTTVTAIGRLEYHTITGDIFVMFQELKKYMHEARLGDLLKNFNERAFDDGIKDFKRKRIIFIGAPGVISRETFERDVDAHRLICFEKNVPINVIAFTEINALCQAMKQVCALMLVSK